jgi:O-antigen ligase
MRKLTAALLWLYVFSVPWDIIPVAGLGTVTRLVGIALIGVALVTIMAEGRCRKPDAVFGMALAFTVASAMSLMWTVSYSATLQAVVSYVQLLGSVWVLREFARTEDQRRALLVAFCLGSFVPALSLLHNFMTGVEVGHGANIRYTATGLNANGVGVLLVVCLPIAWYLMLSYRMAAVRILACTFLVLAPIAVLLTGTRGAFVAGMVAVSIVPLTVPKLSLRYFLIAASLVLVMVAVAPRLPKTATSRFATIPEEITSGNMSRRREIWSAGLQEFPNRPLLGIGAGAYGEVLETSGNKALPAHNLLLGVLVEQGIVGAVLFVGLLVACALNIIRMPPLDRKVWAVVMLSWTVGMMTISILAAQSQTRVQRRHEFVVDERIHLASPLRRAAGN